MKCGLKYYGNKIDRRVVRILIVSQLTLIIRESHKVIQTQRYKAGTYRRVLFARAIRPSLLSTGEPHSTLHP